MLVPEKTSGPSCVTSRPSDSVRMIASLNSERLKTPNEGSKPEFHLRWIRELVPINAHVLTDTVSLGRKVGYLYKWMGELYISIVLFVEAADLSGHATHP